MTFWILIAIITALSVVVLLWPLYRVIVTPAEGVEHDAEVYRDQLKELDRDQAEGLIDANEAEYARGEIGRRLLAAAKAGGASGQEYAGAAKRNLFVQILVIASLPLVAMGLYLNLGVPELPDQPLQARYDNPGRDIGILIAKTEKHLHDNPDDGKGWEIIAPVYLRSGRVDDAVDAYRKAASLLEPTAERLGNLGEALVAQAKGEVTAEARKAFEASLAAQAGDPRASFYLAMALEQSGRTGDAIDAYKAIVANSPPDAPWVPMINERVAAIAGGNTSAQSSADAPGNPTAADMEAAGQMSAADRADMIRSMVEGLDAKLTENPNNFEGWMRLVRSYAMLKESDKAQSALKRALAAFPPDKDQGKALLGLAEQLGLSIEGAAQ